MHKILVVEDDELIRTTLKLNLEKSGYLVQSCGDAETMLEIFNHHHFDLLLLDIMLPGESGLKGLKQIRARGIKTPVIMVTARSDITSKLDTFQYGADDYLTKPFDMRELLVRVKAIIRRSQGERTIPSDRIMRIGHFQVDLEKRTASTNNGEVSLSEKETNLLAYFNTRPQETLKRVDILEEVWGMDADPTPRTIDNYIVKFRRLFEENPEKPKHFISVRARGYRFLH